MHPQPIYYLLLRGIGLPLILSVVTFLLYLPSLKSDFVYDAKAEIFVEGFITSPENLPDVLSFKVLQSKLMLGDRPGQLLYLMLIAMLSGTHPFGYHLCSNLLHAANAALLFVLLRRLVSAEQVKLEGLKIQIALVTITLLFALHPITVEPVSAVSYSSDLLVTFFTLLALLAATAFRPEDMRLAWLIGGLGAFCAFAAVTCKESGLAAALLLIVYWFLYRRREKKAPWLWFLGAATTVTAAFLTARFLFAPPAPYPLSYLGGSFSQLFHNQPRLWVFMMGQLLWPAHLSASYTAQDLNGLTVPYAMGILVIVVLLQDWLAVKSRLGAMGVAVYWLGLATVSNFIPLYRPMADRFYYLPLAGVAMQLLALFLMIPRTHSGLWITTVSLLGLLLPLTLLTLTREEVFSTDFTLWSDTVKVSPVSSTAHSNLGLVLYDRGQVDDAIAEYEKALGSNPSYVEAHYNLGLALAQKGRVDEAVDQYQKALAINSNYVPAHNNLGSVLLHRGQVDEAMIHYRKALEINPNDAEIHSNLGDAFLQKGEVGEAMAQYRKALEIEPDNAGAAYNMANVLVRMGQVDEATLLYRKTLELDPNNAAAATNLANIFSYKGRVDEAIAEYQTALKINPGIPQTHYNLGNILVQTGQIDKAIAQFQEAIKLEPNYSLAKSKLAEAQAMTRQKAGRK